MQLVLIHNSLKGTTKHCEIKLPLKKCQLQQVKSRKMKEIMLCGGGYNV